MYVKVAFDTVFDYFQIFPDDKAKISLYLEGKTDPQSVVISPHYTYTRQQQDQAAIEAALPG
jgi:hypothetical protein